MAKPLDYRPVESQPRKGSLAARLPAYLMFPLGLAVSPPGVYFTLAPDLTKPVAGFSFGLTCLACIPLACVSLYVGRRVGDFGSGAGVELCHSVVLGCWLIGATLTGKFAGMHW